MFPGSIHVNFTVSGSEGDLETAVDDIAREVTDGEGVRYGDTYFQYSGSMLVDGEVYKDMAPKPVVSVLRTCLA